MGLPRVDYDDDADILYVCLTDGEVAETRDLDDLRMVDYAGDGTVVGVEFVGAAERIDLEGVPFADRIAAAIGDSGLPLKVYA